MFIFNDFTPLIVALISRGRRRGCVIVDSNSILCTKTSRFSLYIYNISTKEYKFFPNWTKQLLSEIRMDSPIVWYYSTIVGTHVMACVAHSNLRIVN